MRIVTTRSICFILFLAVSISAIAQKSEEKAYQEESDRIRKEVWGWKNPEFAVRTIPAEFANASKVIIARHVEINGNSKVDGKRGFWADFAFRDYYLTEITREVIKVNDKAAVTEYSEFSYTKTTRSFGFYATEKVYLGVRVIKPDGSIKEISTADIVETNKDSYKKEAKLAIADLQQGDIIDYFIAKKEQIGNYGTAGAYSFPLFEDAPVLHYSVHVAVGKRLATEYRCYNGAPDFKRQTPERDENIFDLVVKNIPANAESSLWISPYRQLPIIRMNILAALKIPFGGSKKMNVRDAGEVYANPSADEFIEDEKITISDIKTYEAQSKTATQGLANTLEGDISKYYFRVVKNMDKMPFDSALAELYYLYRYTKFLHVAPYADIPTVVNTTKKEFNSNRALYDFGSLLRTKDTECEIVFVTSRSAPYIKEILSSNDINWMLLAKGEKDKLFGMSDIFSPAFYVPSEYEDTKQAITMRIVGKKKNFDEGTVNIPGSSALQNARIETINVSTTGNGTDLQVNRRTVLKGHYKPDVQKTLILAEDYINSERKLFGEEKTMIEELESMKSRKSYPPELKAAFDKERVKQKDAFVDEAKGWFDQTVTDLSDYKVDNLGVRHNNPDFVYSSKFNMGGVVKKAGNNLIVDIGKLQGSPLTIRPSQRKRKYDVYMPFARSLQVKITLQIPDGYTAEGVNELNKKVENETGYFIAEATTDGKSVTINVRKSYNHAFEPVGNWDKLLAFLDAANEWSNAKILLKKK